MSKIPTARSIASSRIEAERMIEFAKLHVEAAIEAICNKGQVRGGGVYKTNEGFLSSNPMYIDKSSIQEAYPLTNIK
jgi:hypothetical protein